MRGRCARSGQLVFNDLGDSAHGAFFNTIAAGYAGILVDNFYNSADNLEYFLGASVDTDTTTNAFIDIDDGMGHNKTPFRLKALVARAFQKLSARTIPFLDAIASGIREIFAFGVF